MKKNDLNNNDFLLNLNFDKLTNEQKAAVLAQIIDHELEKPEKDVDVAFVNECLAYLNELNGESFQKSEEELNAGLMQIYAKGGDRQGSTEMSTPKKPHSRRRKTLLKAAVILAAALIVVFSSFTVIAKTAGYNSALDWVSANIDKLFNLKPGEYEVDGITIKIGDEERRYKSLDELVEKEHLDIMYPTVLPGNMKISEVRKIDYEDGKIDIWILTNSNHSMISVHNYNLSEYAVPDEIDKIQCNGNTYGYFQTPDGRFQANCVTTGYAYCITCDNYDDMVTIIQGMKE